MQQKNPSRQLGILPGSLRIVNKTDFTESWYYPGISHIMTMSEAKGHEFKISFALNIITTL